jgi:hypothetical protein
MASWADDLPSEPLLESDWGNEKSRECATRYEIFGKKTKKACRLGKPSMLFST